MNYGAVKVLYSYVITHLESLYLDFKLTLFKKRTTFRDKRFYFRAQ